MTGTAWPAPRYLATGGWEEGWGIPIGEVLGGEGQDECRGRLGEVSRKQGAEKKGGKAREGWRKGVITFFYRSNELDVRIYLFTYLFIFYSLYLF